MALLAKGNYNSLVVDKLAPVPGGPAAPKAARCDIDIALILGVKMKNVKQIDFGGCFLLQIGNYWANTSFEASILAQFAGTCCSRSLKSKSHRRRKAFCVNR